MDAPLELPHCVTMESPPDGRNGNQHKLLAVVDDDQSVRESLPDLLKEFGFAARVFSSAEEFLASGCASEASCLILDIVMPEMSGPELRDELEYRGQHLPIVFITGQRDETVRVQALRHGAAGFLPKPFSDVDLLAAIKTALQTL